MWNRSPLSLACLLSAVLLPASTTMARIQIIGADEVRERIEIRDGVATLDVDGHRWEMVTDPRDSILSTLGNGEFHPMDRREVEAAFSSLRGAPRLPNVRVFILPYPRREVLKSSCHGSTIFLSPGIHEVSRDHVHMTVVHELGHVFQHVRAAEGSPAWTTYLQLRGLTDPNFHAAADHRNRPAEIFAEDFRVLLGGPVAASAGAIENTDLPAPDQVRGLSMWFLHGSRTTVESLAPTEVGPLSFPNPFRAAFAAPLQVRFSGAAEGRTAAGRADVFDLQGRAVRTLRGSVRDGEDVVFHWDGRDRSGRIVATGTYFVRWQQRPELGTARVQVLH